MAARPPVTINPQSESVNGNELYEVNIENEELGQPFNFQIKRKSTNSIM